MEHIIGIGAMKVSQHPEDSLKTYALATCVAVTIYCPSRRTSGMIHIALPFPPGEGLPNHNLCYYARTGIPLLLKCMVTQYECPIHDLQIGIFGGADSIREHDVFMIGRKNIQEVKQQLLHIKQLQIRIDDTGGSFSKTLTMKVATGEMKKVLQPLVI